MVTATIDNTKMEKHYESRAHGKRSLTLVNLGNTLFYTHTALIAASVDVLNRRLQPNEIKMLDREEKTRVYDSAIRDYWYLMSPNQTMLHMLRNGEAISEGVNDLILFSSNNGPKSTESGPYNLLRKHLHFMEPSYELLLRPVALAGVTDYAWKNELIKKRVLHYDEITVYEDRKDNLDQFRSRLGNHKIHYYHVQKGSIKKIS